MNLGLWRRRSGRGRRRHHRHRYPRTVSGTQVSSARRHSAVKAVSGTALRRAHSAAHAIAVTFHGRMTAGRRHRLRGERSKATIPAIAIFSSTASCARCCRRPWCAVAVACHQPRSGGPHRVSMFSGDRRPFRRLVVPLPVEAMTTVSAVATAVATAVAVSTRPGHSLRERRRRSTEAAARAPTAATGTISSGASCAVLERRARRRREGGVLPKAAIQTMDRRFIRRRGWCYRRRCTTAVGSTWAVLLPPRARSSWMTTNLAEGAKVQL